MNHEERTELRAALAHWRKQLTPGAYPATAVQALEDKFRGSSTAKLATRAEQQLAITALNRHGSTSMLYKRLVSIEDRRIRRDDRQPSTAGARLVRV